MLISTWSDKGGTGKTTIAILLGTFFDAKLYDLDPQGDLSRWAQAAKKDCVSLSPRSQNALLAAAKDSAISVVDCPPGRQPSAIQGMAFSQVVVIPTRTGDADLVALSRAIETVKKVQHNGNPNLVATVVLNAFRDTARAQSLPKPLALMSDCEYIGELKERVAYEESYSAGTSVLDDKNSPAAVEANSMLEKLKRIVEGSRRKGLKRR